MPTVMLELATPHDAQRLAQIARRAFDSDVVCGAKGPGGPHGYDSFVWHARLMRSASEYLRIMADGEMVGGIVVFNRGHGHLRLGTIFVDPGYHRRGIGLEAMRRLLARYPKAHTWTLDTPAWNTRTRPFYEKLGFRAVKRTGDSVLYERRGE